MIRVADEVTDWFEVYSLGLCLEFDYNQITRYRNQSQDIRLAALQLLMSFYNGSFISKEKKWGLIIEALSRMDKEVVVYNLGIDKLYRGARAVCQGQLEGHVSGSSVTQGQSGRWQKRIEYELY